MSRTDLFKPGKDSKVMVLLIYYRTPEQRAKIDKLLGTGKRNGITAKINREVGEITMPYDGQETEDLWETVKKEDRKRVKLAIKEMKKLHERMKT